MPVATDLRRKESEILTSNAIQVYRPKDINEYLQKKGYRLGKVIGEGSYSKVRICTRQTPEGKDRTPIASKIIDKRKASDDFVEKFLPRELEIIGRMNHPNIVSVRHVVEYMHNVFIFMDYCDKGDLLDFIKKKGFLPEDLCRHYFRQILLAVQYLHRLDLTHRDLKCENVLLTKRDEVMLSDFGFARACRDVDTGKRILSNTYCGSAAYAAPEILQGTQYNPKLYDMWSTGCILFIMLTGHMPFDESDIPKMLQQQLQGIITYPSGVNSLISKSAKSFISHLLEPDVTRRATVDQALANRWLKQDEKETNFAPSRSAKTDKRFDQGDNSCHESTMLLSESPSKARRNITSRADHADESTETMINGLSARKDEKLKVELGRTDASPTGYLNPDRKHNQNSKLSARKRFECRPSENPSQSAISDRNRGSLKH